MLLRFFACVLLINSVISEPPLISVENKKYEPTRESLDSRALPSWYDDAKIGIFLHWGVYSVPSFGNSSEWFWSKWNERTGSMESVFMKERYPLDFKYQDFGKDFKAEFYEPQKWANLFKRSGAQYVVITSKHYDGFTLFPSNYSFGWNSVDTGPHRDLVGELAEALREANLRLGLYYTLLEWFNPFYLIDKANNYSTDIFPTMKMIPELKELVTKYKPDIVWSDGEWEALDSYWKSKEFLAWLYNDSPVKDTVMVNDKWRNHVVCRKDGFYSCMGKYNKGVLQEHKWESAIGIDKKSWGFRRNTDISDYMTIEELLTTVATTISCRGNLLINVGPSKDGTIDPIFQERLLQLGEWLGYNGEAIYGSRPWIYQNETQVRVWYTSNNDIVYAICLDWPEDGILSLQKPLDLFVDQKPAVSMLASQELEWTLTEDRNKVNIIFPNKAHVKVQWAWVLKIYQKPT